MKKKKWLVILGAAAFLLTSLAGVSFYGKKQLMRELKAVESSSELMESKTQVVHQEKLADQDTSKTQLDNSKKSNNIELRGKQKKQKVLGTQKTIIALDPGHQGPGIDMSGMEENAPGSGIMKQRNNSGTTGRYSGIPEYQLNLDIALQVKAQLVQRGYEVVMSRENNDTAVSNRERAIQANESGALFCVRIHANGSEDPESYGALCLIPSQENPTAGNLYDKSFKLASDILECYCEETGFENRGVQVNDTMTGINWSQIPVVILEMGFMTNEREDTLMAEDTFQKTMADGIVQGIEKYCTEK